jgi:Rod binding domain-containing protein
MISPLQTQLPLVPLNKDDQLRDLATKLEASFLAEMLKSAGFGAAREGFGGGVGEEQFSSFVVENHARNLADSGGIGLAENIFQSLKGRKDDF